MRTIPVDTSMMTFLHFGDVEPAASQDGTHRSNQEGVPLWKIPVVVLIPGAKAPEGELITVASASAPKVEQNAEVRFRGLRARQWSMGTSSGISLSADAVEVAKAKVS